MGKNFNLSIYKQYYDQIKAGTKRIEYRKMSEYYARKFIVGGVMPGEGRLMAKHYDTVTFYHKGDPPLVVKWEGLFLYPRKNAQWFAIRLGEIMSPKQSPSENG